MQPSDGADVANRRRVQEHLLLPPLRPQAVPHVRPAASVTRRSRRCSVFFLHKQKEGLLQLTNT